VDLQPALAFLAEHRRGILIATRANGRPHASNMAYDYTPDHGARMSVTADRVKTRLVQARPQATLHVSSGDFWQWVAVDGDVTISPVAADPEDDVATELLDVYERIRREPHPDHTEFRRAMVEDRRCVVTLRPTAAIGQLG
jgi:PPOX class probable F420-dependent enzyme